MIGQKKRNCKKACEFLLHAILGGRELNNNLTGVSFIRISNDCVDDDLVFGEVELNF